MAEFYLPTGHASLEAKVVWSYTQNVQANTSTIYAHIEARRTSSYMSTMDLNNPKLTFWIDGQERVQYASYNFGSHAVWEWFWIGSEVSATVSHSNDGTKSLNIATLYDTSVSNLGALNKVQWVTLNTIPRNSTISSGSSWVLGHDSTIYINRMSSSYTHILDIYVGNSSGYTLIGSRENVGASFATNFTQTEQANMAQVFIDKSNAWELNTKIIMSTWSGSTRIGDYAETFGTVWRPSESNISSTATFNLTTTGVPYTLSGVNSSQWITHSLQLLSNSFNKTITLANGASTSGNFALTQAELESLYNQYTTQTSAPFNFYLVTKLAGKTLGTVKWMASDVQGNFDVVALAPTFSGTPTYADTNTAVTAITTNNQMIVRNKSNLKVTIPASSITTKFGATATTYAVSVNGTEKTAAYSASAVTIDFGTVNVATNTTAQVSLVDSRGIRTSKTITITVYDYSNPTIVGSAVRANGFDTSTSISATGGYASVNAKNTIASAKYRYKAVTSGTWGSWVALTATPSGGTFTTNTATVSLDNSSQYNLEFQVIDSFGTTTEYSYLLDSGKPILFIDKTHKSVGVGKFPVNNDSLEVAGSLFVDGTAGNVYHTGKKPTTSEIGAAKALTLANGYHGLTHNDGTTTEWLRTTSNGLIPFVSGGYSSSLGTVNWPFRDVHAQNMYLGGKNLAATTAINASPNIGIWHYNDYSGGGFSYMKYWKTVDNIIHMQGLAYLESGYRGDFQTLFTLPVGYRPHAIVTFTVACSTGTTRIDIGPAGNVQLRGTSSPDWVSLAGIAFYQAN